jgi:alkanesulfonate monooxygenase SsuD/methylene tetrahydromethanopterin reductase-like flavin-dependent oxidoreductase (luciferase family)
MQLGIISLSDIQAGHTAAERVQDAIHYARLADRLSLDMFALGEHHAPEFAVPSPAVVLAAIAARTEHIRLTSGVTVLPVLDPVRVYEDFAQLDLVSSGRAEITVGRSAFTEPFALFGERLEEYDSLFAEKLGLLLELRDRDHVTWSGRFRAPLHNTPIGPRAIQQPLPIWVGVGGSPESAARAGRLGLPMTVGLIGGPLQNARHAIDLYRAAGQKAGHPEKLRVGISTHFHIGQTATTAREIYPYYHEYLRPKTPGGRGFLVDRGSFEAGTRPGQALMIGSSQEVAAKILDTHHILGGIDRFFGQVDWGGLPRDTVEASIERFATEVAPAIRAAL